MIGRLTARIFAIFWLTLALVLMLVLMLPKLDSRQMTELLESGSHGSKGAIHAQLVDGIQSLFQCLNIEVQDISPDVQKPEVQ